MAGIPIAEITYGQMPVIADHTRAILALAARESDPTDEFQRVLNCGKVWQTYCRWGLLHGRISDGASPFHACSHAYLAALQEWLLPMDADPTGTAAIDLVRRVDADILLSSTALKFCNYSAMPYDTATLVHPLWSDRRRHPTTLVSFLVFADMAMSLAVAFLRWVTRPQPAA